MKKLAYIASAMMIFTTFSQALECIPHHMGESSWPANTSYALKHSIKNFPINNVTLVLSSDGYPVAFHGFDLAKTTNGIGNPESYNLKYLESLDAAYKFHPQDQYPLRNKGIKIPTLKELLLVLPSNPRYKLILDLKSRHNQQLIKNVVATINGLDNPESYWKKLVFYSTDESALVELKKQEPKAQLFLNRQETLEILLNAQINEQQKSHIKNFNWVGFEMQRKLCERFTLGENCAYANQLWTKDKIRELREINPNIQVVVFAADSLDAQLKAMDESANYIYINEPNTSKFCAKQ
jgi:glycerophosphoryl diester phosphodiesterase